MKKKVYRERYERYIKDFKVLDKEELKELKAEVIETKPKRKRVFKKVEE